MNLLLDYGLHPALLLKGLLWNQRQKTQEQWDKEKRQSKGLGLFNFIVFKSTMSWRGKEVKRTQRNPPSSYKVHVLNHFFSVTQSSAFSNINGT